MVRVYIDEVLVKNENYLQDHINSLEKDLKIFKEEGLKVNSERSFFGRMETKYLCFWFNKNGIRPLSSKEEAITSIDVTTKVSEINKFVGIVKYYRYIWCKRSHILSTRLNYAQLRSI